MRNIKFFKMKKIILSAGIFCMLVMVLNSCNKIKEALNIDIDLNPDDIEFTIPIITQTGSQTISDVNVNIDIDSIIKANNDKLALSNIKSVKVKSCTITMLDGDVNNNFSALEAVNIQFQSNVNATPVTVVDLTNNPDVEAYSLTVPINTTVELKEYFKANTFSYRILGNARKTTNKEIHCKASIKYSMNVGL